MSSLDLKPISYVVLGAVGEHGASTPELVDMARRGAPVVWAAADSQMYSEPKRLAGLGYLKTRKEPGKTRSRTVYTLTRKGRGALERWLRTRAPLPRIQHEAAIRLLAADMVPDDVTLRALLPLRTELDRLDRLMDESEERAHSLPHRERYLLLQISLIRRTIQAHRDWLDEVERTLS
jgi:DNA-binding PadR family transcriptional regulator